MTVRLYYDDPALLRFEARVSEVREAGGRPALVLDRTAFYPTSGGQPHDTGVLGGARVLEVLEADGGEVLHVLDTEPLPTHGDAAHGDAARGGAGVGIGTGTGTGVL